MSIRKRGRLTTDTFCHFGTAYRVRFETSPVLVKSKRSGGFDYRFVHQQDGNTVPDRVNAMAFAAFKALAGFFLDQEAFCKPGTPECREVPEKSWRYFTPLRSSLTSAG